MRDLYILNPNLSRLSNLLRNETIEEEIRSQREDVDFLELNLIYYE
jgi:hypothetical protein